jgi:hypothetical protein
LRLLSPKRQQRYYEFDQMVKCRDLVHGAEYYGAATNGFLGGTGFGGSKKTSDVNRFVAGA